jgi:hypothetical protein
MSIIETVMRADHLWPDDRFRRGARVMQALHVAVPAGAPVVVTAREIGGADTAPTQFTIDAGELLRMVPV